MHRIVLKNTSHAFRILCTFTLITWGFTSLWSRVRSPVLCARPLVPLLSCDILIWVPLLRLWEPQVGTVIKLKERRRWLQRASAGTPARRAFHHLPFVRSRASHLSKPPSQGPVYSELTLATWPVSRLKFVNSGCRNAIRCLRSWRAYSVTISPSTSKTDFLKSRFCPSAARSSVVCGTTQNEYCTKKGKTASPLLFRSANHTHCFLPDQQHWIAPLFPSSQ